MQIKINSSQVLSENSIRHIEGLINNFQWQQTPHSIKINIDSTLKDVDDKIYVQLVSMFDGNKTSVITDALNITGAITLAQNTINSKMNSGNISKRLNKEIFKAA